mmetsp:Transcript_7155/g.10449  ORF Transcript_7155/g.10449 Transcript_7155/m.10449 type:complete len:495 (+) Transcript_7155:96-1580(+)
MTADSNHADEDDAGVHEETKEDAESEKTILQEFLSPNLPTPLPPEKCPLFCCFYAEFDNVVGPQIVHQSPPNFMDQQMGNIASDQINTLLQKTFNNDEGEENKATKETGNEQSIFDSTCDYIITGNELAGKILTVSTHNMHILTRPTVISDNRYERNSLFFCVGFVIRRSEDVSPFRPCLARWANALLKLEVEHHFLSNKKAQLQPILRTLLMRLNAGECNLVLTKEQAAFNVKLFRPPKTVAPPVADYVVPVLLRKDWQIQMFDWDLAINWVVNNIDGISNAKALSEKLEIDLEMVEACLRVLCHHNVIALVDMFFYSNRYEATGKQLEGKLLDNAIEYVGKGRGANMVDDSDHTKIFAVDEKLKLSIVELYYSFDRTQTMADIFCEKTKSTTMNNYGRNDQQWQQLLEELDHRRFITFGVIHGLLQRIHNNPLAMIAPSSRKSSNSSFAYQVAAQMNGRSCDDALVSQFEWPIEELIRTVRTVGAVADLYAA